QSLWTRYVHADSGENTEDAELTQYDLHVQLFLDKYCDTDVYDLPPYARIVAIDDFVDAAVIKEHLIPDAFDYVRRNVATTSPCARITCFLLYACGFACLTWVFLTAVHSVFMSP